MTACPSCGSLSRQGAAFCGECGAKLATDVAAPSAASERPGYITLPPGVTPVVATNTGPAPSPVTRAPAPPTPAVSPPPPAASPRAPSPAVEPEQPSRPPAAAELADLDATRAAAPRRSGTWALVAPDGTIHTVAASAVIGRAPDAAAHGVTHVVSLGAGEKSVSKSHAVIELTPSGLSVRDLGSVNGVLVVHADGSETEASQTTAVELRDGDELELGQVVVKVKKG